jgi:hypothetical protein
MASVFKHAVELECSPGRNVFSVPAPSSGVLAGLMTNIASGPSDGFVVYAYDRLDAAQGFDVDRSFIDSANPDDDNELTLPLVHRFAEFDCTTEQVHFGRGCAYSNQDEEVNDKSVNQIHLVVDCTAASAQTIQLGYTVSNVLSFPRGGESVVVAPSFDPASILSENDVPLLRQQLFTDTTPTLAGRIEDDASVKASHDAIDARAYEFDGTDDYLALASDIDQAGDFTACAWIRPDSVAPFYAFGSSTLDYLSLLNATESRVRISGTNTIVTHGHTFTTGEWQLVMWVRESGTISVYRNNVAPSSTISDSGTLRLNRIGCYGNATACGDGKIFDARVYGKALSADEREFVYTFGQSGTDPTLDNCVGWYKCDDNHPTIAYDSSGNGNHGTKTNITPATFHYTGRDIPWSWANEVGYSKIWGVASTSTGFVGPEILSDASGLGTVDVTMDIRTTDVQGFIFGEGVGTGAWAGYFRNSTSTGTEYLSGSPTYWVNDVELTRSVDLLNAISTGDWVTLEIRNLNLSDYSDGLHFSGYASFTYFWDGEVRNLVIDGVTYEGTTVIPRDESDPTKDVLGGDLQYVGQAKIPAQAVESHCLTLDGVDDYVDISEALSQFSTDSDFAGHLYFKPGITKTQVQVLLSAYAANDNHFIISCASGILRVTVHDGVRKGKSISVTDLSRWYLLEWVYVAATGTLTAYLDGQEMSGTFSDIPDAVVGAVIGAETDHTGEYTGQICDVYIEGGSHWPCAEGGGDTVYDVSGNGNHGTITNATTTPGAGAWANTQDVTHWNLAKGYSPTWVVTSKTNAITGPKIVDDTTGMESVDVSFDIKLNLQSSGLIFGNGVNTSPWLLAFGDGQTSTVLVGGTVPTSMVVGSTEVIDGVTTRDEMHSLLVTGDWVTVEMSGVDFASYADVFLAGYGTVPTWRWDGEVRNLVIDGVRYDGYKIPALTDGTADALGNTIQDTAGAYHNGSESKIDTTSGVLLASDFSEGAYFNGSTSTATVPAIMNTDSWEVRAWFKRHSLVASSQNVLIGFGNSLVSLANTVNVRVGGITLGADKFNSDITISNGIWYYIRASREGADCELEIWSLTEAGLVQLEDKAVTLTDPKLGGLSTEYVGSRSDAASWPSNITLRYLSATKDGSLLYSYDLFRSGKDTSGEGNDFLVSTDVTYPTVSWETARAAFTNRDNPLFQRDTTVSGIKTRDDRNLIYRQPLQGADLALIAEYSQNTGS